MQDVRFALRLLRKHPAFSLTAIVVLALGLCASLTIFAFTDAALIRPLPYRDPARLVGVFETAPLFPRSNLSYLDYLDWKQANTTFSSLSAFRGWSGAWTSTSGAQRVTGARVSADFFRTLGVSPILGRDFHDGEDTPAAARVVILSYAAWQARFGGAGVIGMSLTLDGDPYVVVGVLPRTFQFAPVGVGDFWIPLRVTSGCDTRRGCHSMYGVARLKDGVSVQTAAANVTAIAASLERQYPDSNRGQGAAIVPLTDVILGTVSPILFVLLGGAALLLLIAAVNVCGLLLVRAEARRREIAVRGALGASRARMLRQFTIEGALLALASAVVALPAALLGMTLLRGLVPANIQARLPFMTSVGLNGHVVAAAAAIVVLEAALFTAIPLVHISFATGVEAFAEGSRGSAGRGWRRIGTRLVTIELAMAMVLLAAGGLLSRSLYGLLHVDVGMQTEGVALIGVNFPAAAYKTSALQVAVERQLIARVAALPGVVSAGAASVPPVQGGNTSWIRVVGHPYNGEHNEVNFRDVDAGYFATLQARVARGRGITDADDASKAPVVVINQAFVRTYFGSEDPIGRQVAYAPTSTTPPMEVVGIVNDIKESALDAVTPPTMYLPFAQDPDSGFWVFARTRQPADVLVPELRQAVRAQDPGATTFGAAALAASIGDSQAAYIRRAAAWLVGGFASLAWLLGVVGLYGVIAYSVSRRTREIGVRIALGAQKRSVSGLILREAGVVIAIGIAIGVAASAASAGVLRGLLFGVAPWDAVTLGGVAAVLGLSGLAASYVPARRAAALNPIDALRAE